MPCSRQSPRALEAGLLQRTPCQSTGLYSGSTVRCDASCCQTHPPTASQRSGVRCHPSPAPLARHLGAGPFQTVRARVPLYPWNSSFLPIEVLCSGQLDRRTITPPFSRIWRSVHSRDEHCYHWSAGICGRLSRCMEQSPPQNSMKIASVCWRSGKNWKLIYLSPKPKLSCVMWLCLFLLLTMLLWLFRRACKNIIIIKIIIKQMRSTPGISSKHWKWVNAYFLLADKNYLSSTETRYVIIGKASECFPNQFLEYPRTTYCRFVRLTKSDVGRTTQNGMFDSYR